MKKIFAAAAIFISNQVYSQTDSSANLDEVVVSANKYANKTSQTGKVITIITRQDIERAGSKDLSQLLNEQGGIYINGANSNPGKDKNIYLRGAKFDHTLITVDGVPVYDASGIGSNFDIRQIPIDNVERIEILKGSQSTLYGSDAIAGVINIITRKGNNKDVGGYGLLSYGSFKTVRANAGLNGKSKKLDYNIGYSFFDTEGISEVEKPEIVSTKYDKDGYQQNAVHASLGLQATPSIRLQPYIRFSKIKGDLDGEAFVDEQDYTYAAENFQTGVRNEFIINGAKLNLLYNFNRTNRSYTDDSTKSINSFYTYSNASYRADEHFAESYIVLPFSKIKLTAGVDYRFSKTDQSSLYVYSPFPAATSKINDDSARQNQLGIYSAINVNTAQNINLEAGGRFNHHSAYGNNFAFNINPSYLCKNMVKVFANVSTGYKVPSLYQLYSEYGNGDLDPETSLNIEGGLQYFSKNQKANVRFTYFNRKVEDVIVFFYNSTTFQSQYINQDKQKDNGLEVDGKWDLSDKMNLKLFYSHIDGEITTKNNGKDTNYFNLIRRPKNSFSLTVEGNLARKLYISAQLQAFGKNKDVYFDPVTFEQKNITLDNYILISFYTEYQFLKGRLKLFADLRNITDENYREIYGYSTPGFNAYAGIRAAF